VGNKYTGDIALNITIRGQRWDLTVIINYGSTRKANEQLSKSNTID